MAYSNYDRTVAFAGMCQAASLVQSVAKDGLCDENGFKTSINAILNLNPSSTIDIFGHEANLQIGLETLINGVNSSSPGNEVTRYMISLMALERKLNSRRDAMSQLGDRIDTLVRQTEHFDLFDDQMIANVASVYLDVISPIGPRIQVTGTPEVLQQPGNQQKVRALLLSGVRCAVLWRQVGGKRRHLILGRNKMVNQAKILLARI